MAETATEAPVRATLVWVAEVSAVLSAVGFLTSAAVNTYMFRRLGLNYLQIATPSDVLMGGLDYAFSAAVFGAAIIAGTLVAWAISRLPKWAKWSLVIMFSGLFVALLLSWLTPISIISPAATMMLLTGPFWVGLARPFFWPLGQQLRQPNASMLQFALPLVWFALVLVAVTPNVVLSRESSSQQRLYFAPGPLSVSDESMAARSCDWPFVEWIGAQFTIVNCTGRLWIIPSDQVQATLGSRQPGDTGARLRVEVMDPQELWAARDQALGYSGPSEP